MSADKLYDRLTQDEAPMSLDKLHGHLTQDVGDSLEEMRKREAEVERKFPGYPPYVSEVVLQKIEWAVAAQAKRMHQWLTSMFGYVAMKDVTPEELEHEMRDLAQNVAHQAAGHEMAKGVLQAQKASHNMLLGTLAGITLGANKDTPEESTTDASPET